MDINLILKQVKESKTVDFKEVFDTKSLGSWCELIKDIIAMANSGGGAIAIGLKDDGTPSKQNLSSVFNLDPADITNKIFKYTDEQFGDFEIIHTKKDGYGIEVIQIGGVPTPIVFTKPGAYIVEFTNNQQKTAFSQGTIYYRHGAKSEPANSNDIRKSLQKEIERTRKAWLNGIRKISYSPPTPVYKKVWDDSPYSSSNEMLIGALKSWRSNHNSYISECDIWELYKSRNELSLDEEIAECLLESAVNRYAPVFYFAKHLSEEKLREFIKRVVKEAIYPAPNSLLKIAYIMDGSTGSTIINYIAENCMYPSIRRQIVSLKQNKRMDVNSRIAKYFNKNIKIGGNIIDISCIEHKELENILDSMSIDEHNNIKVLDAYIYGPLIVSKR
jgi:hypothetical protein